MTDAKRLPLTPEEARAELAAALNAIEDKVNVPRRLSRAGDRARRKIAKAAEEKPAAVGAGAVGAVALVGLGVWAVVRGITRH